MLLAAMCMMAESVISDKRHGRQDLQAACGLTWSAAQTGFMRTAQMQTSGVLTQLYMCMYI